MRSAEYDVLSSIVRGSIEAYFSDDMIAQMSDARLACKTIVRLV